MPTDEQTAEGRRIAEQYRAEARERGREVPQEVIDAMASAEAQRLALHEGRPTSPRSQSPSPTMRRPLADLTQTALARRLAAKGVQPLPREPLAFACSYCQDSGIVPGPSDAPQSRLAPIPRSSRVFITCPHCPADTQRARNLTGSMAPGDMLAARFSAYRPRSTAQGDALALAVAWAQGVDERPILILVGPTGTGKSHLAKAAILWRVEHGERATWATAEGVLQAIRRQFGAEVPHYPDTREGWATRPILALDDVGAGYGTGWNMAEIEQVIFERYERARPTVITSNLDLDALHERQNDPFGRLVSRLSDARRTIYAEVEGPDYRLESGSPDA